jgi:hypothetical protein
MHDEHVQLVKGSLVQQRLNSLAGSHLFFGVLCLYPVRATGLLSLLSQLTQVVDPMISWHVGVY